MKRKQIKLSLLIALLFSASSLWAQHEAKSRNFNMSIGFQDYSPNCWDQGYLNSAASFEYFFTKNQSLEVSFIGYPSQRTAGEYHNNIPVRLYNLGGALHYNYTFYTFNIKNKRAYLYAILGGVYAKERMTDPTELLYDPKPITPRNLYSVEIGLGLELNISQYFSVFGNVIPRREFTYNDSVFQGHLGAKLYF